MTDYSKELVAQYTQKRDNYCDTDERLIGIVIKVGIKGKDALDLGCGDGRYAAKFLEMGAKSVKGIDISPAMFELAKENHPNIELKLGDVENLPYEDESFDLIFSNFVLHYCKDVNKAFSEIARTLKKGGNFIGIFNSIETDDKDILGRVMPVLLGYEDPVTVHNVMRLEDTYESAIKAAGLEVVEYIDEPNNYAHADPSFKHFSKIKKLKNSAYLLKKSAEK